MELLLTGLVPRVHSWFIWRPGNTDKLALWVCADACIHAISDTRWSHNTIVKATHLKIGYLSPQSVRPRCLPDFGEILFLAQTWRPVLGEPANTQNTWLSVRFTFALYTFVHTLCSLKYGDDISLLSWKPCLLTRGEVFLFTYLVSYHESHLNSRCVHNCEMHCCSHTKLKVYEICRLYSLPLPQSQVGIVAVPRESRE